ncbi:MAG TPA: hypothetical protein VLL05_18785 [Terriglobales bacterium]|nr:hypothetical protein [Terriglobales bacterium]
MRWKPLVFTLSMRMSDYSEPLLNAKNYLPDVLINIMGGDDQVSSQVPDVRWKKGWPKGRR